MKLPEEPMMLYSFIGYEREQGNHRQYPEECWV